MILDAAGVQVVGHVLLVELVDGQLGQEGLGLRQLFFAVARVNLLEAKLSQLVGLYTILIELVKDERKYFLGGVLAPQEDHPQALGNHNYFGRVWLEGRKSDNMPDGCVEVFLKIMVRTSFELLPPPFIFITKLTLGACFFYLLDWMR
jgi:hypothetical protein